MSKAIELAHNRTAFTGISLNEPCDLSDRLFSGFSRTYSGRVWGRYKGLRKPGNGT